MIFYIMEVIIFNKGKHSISKLRLNINSFVPLVFQNFRPMKRLLFLCVIFSFVIDALGGQVVTPGDSIHVNHYDIHLTYVDMNAQEFTAETTIQLTTLVDNLTAIPLELMELTVDSLYLDGEKVSDFSHVGQELVIPCPVSMVSGAEYTVKVWYHGQPFHENWGGFHWGGDYCFNLGVGFVSQPHNLGKAWFPCVDDFTDRATYDIKATVGEGYSAISGGTLISKTSDVSKNVTWHWHIEHPIPTYLASITIGLYELYSDSYQGLERDIPVEIWARPSEINNVEASFIHLHEVMDLFEEKFGPYPFEKIGYSGTAIGAMEHAGNIAYPHFAINGNLSYESLWVHELSHMWFGDMVTCHEAEEMWVNEGWGKYCENYYTEEIYDYETYIGQMNDINKEVLQYVHTVSGDGGYFALDGVPQDVTYGMTSYEKGSLIIHTFRNYLGDDVFFEAARHYLDEYSFDDASSEELRDAFAESSGVNLDGFFDNWVFQPGRPGFVLEGMEEAEPGRYDVTIRQKGKGRSFYGNDNRFEIAFYDDAMNREIRQFAFDGEVGTNQYDDLPFEPVAVVIDPEYKMMDAVTDLGHIFKNTGLVNFADEYIKADITNLGADSIYLHMTHYWVAPDPVEPPLPGLTLSDYRYWHVDGVFPENVEGQMHFFYSKAGNLDNNIITDPNDSIVLLYRPHAGVPWEQISFSQLGPWSVGYLITDEIKKGDYTLAVWDEEYVGQEETYMKPSEMLVYPNPSEDRFTFVLSTQEPVTIEVFGLDGKRVFATAPGKNSVVWDAADCPAGTYTATMLKDGVVIVSETLIKSR